MVQEDAFHCEVNIWIKQTSLKGGSKNSVAATMEGADGDITCSEIKVIQSGCRRKPKECFLTTGKRSSTQMWISQEMTSYLHQCQWPRPRTGLVTNPQCFCCCFLFFCSLWPSVLEWCPQPSQANGLLHTSWCSHLAAHQQASFFGGEEYPSSSVLDTWASLHTSSTSWPGQLNRWEISSSASSSLKSKYYSLSRWSSRHLKIQLVFNPAICGSKVKKMQNGADGQFCVLLDMG